MHMSVIYYINFLSEKKTDADDIEKNYTQPLSHIQH